MLPCMEKLSFPTSMSVRTHKRILTAVNRAYIELDALGIKTPDGEELTKEWFLNALFLWLEGLDPAQLKPVIEYQLQRVADTLRGEYVPKDEKSALPADGVINPMATKIVSRGGGQSVKENKRTKRA